METVFVEKLADLLTIPRHQRVMTLGYFDGVHQGHQKVLTTALNLAAQKKIESTVVTFKEYPGITYHHVAKEKFSYLTPLADKLAIFEQMGFDQVLVVDLATDIGKLSPQLFVEHFMLELAVTDVVAGFDFTYGDRQVANMTNLADYAHHKLTVHEISPQVVQGKKISSTWIRSALAGHDLKTVNLLLGRSFQIKGQVIHGRQVGRKLGFPTANIQPLTQQRLPALGIYATRLQIGSTWWPSMTSVGRNVTFGQDFPVTIETNVLNYQGDLYGQSVILKFDAYLREEKKFDSATGLIDQLKLDQQCTAAYYQSKQEGQELK